MNDITEMIIIGIVIIIYAVAVVTEAYKSIQHDKAKAKYEQMVKMLTSGKPVSVVKTVSEYEYGFDTPEESDDNGQE